jgi:hypothetical protein
MKGLFFGAMITGLVLLAACGAKSGKQAGPPQEKWKKFIEHNGVTITVRYQPGAGSASALNTGQTTSFNTPGSGRYFYFDVAIEKPSYEADKKTAEYLGYKMDSSFFFIQGADTLLPAFWQNIAAGRKGYFEYVVAFEAGKETSQAQVMVKDNVFGLGRQYFLFNYKDLVNK